MGIGVGIGIGQHGECISAIDTMVIEFEINISLPRGSTTC